MHMQVFIQRWWVYSIQSFLFNSFHSVNGEHLVFDFFCQLIFSKQMNVPRIAMFLETASLSAVIDSWG